VTLHISDVLGLLSDHLFSYFCISSLCFIPIHLFFPVHCAVILRTYHELSIAFARICVKLYGQMNSEALALNRSSKGECCKHNTELKYMLLGLVYAYAYDDAARIINKLKQTKIALLVLVHFK
jgi:hypothetical protein